ncbi:hypothetical protein D3C71_1369030 [compost metagenome]
MDDDDKIRRNLMVTSAIIIGAAWFNVSLPEVLERLFSIKSPGGTQSVQVSDWKVWIAALLVLGYLSWRYRWSDEVEKALQLFKEGVQLRYIVLYQTEYLPLVGTWIKSGVIPKNAHAELSPIAAHFNQVDATKSLGRPDVVSVKSSGAISMDSANVGATVIAFWGGEENVNRSSSIQSNIYIDPKRHEAIVRRSQRFTLFNSKSSMSLLWPVLIGGAAGVIAAFKLAFALTT